MWEVDGNSVSHTVTAVRATQYGVWKLSGAFPPRSLSSSRFVSPAGPFRGPLLMPVRLFSGSDKRWLDRVAVPHSFAELNL